MPLLQERWRQAAVQGQEFSSEYRVVTPTRDIRWVSGHAVVMNAENGKTAGYIGTVEDITERRATELALEQSESTNNAFIRAIPDPMYIVNREGIILDARSAKENELLDNTGNIVGKSVLDLILQSSTSPQSLVSSTRDLISRALDTGEVQSLEYQIDIQGEQRRREARYVANGDDEVLIITGDITERVKAQESLAESEELPLSRPSQGWATGSRFSRPQYSLSSRH